MGVRRIARVARVCEGLRGCEEDCEGATVATYAGM